MIATSNTYLNNLELENMGDFFSNFYNLTVALDLFLIFIINVIKLL